MAKSNTIEVVIAIDDGHLADIGDVSAELKKAGLSAIRVQPTIGTISGQVPEAKLSKLEHVMGVAAVERSRVVGPA
jgi:hypothetical protein